MNNNPEAFSRARRPIVEFSIEDARAVRKLELKAKHRDERHKKQSKDEGKPRGAEQAAKRVAAKEKKEKQKGAQKSDGPTQKRARGEDGADNSTKTPTRANLRRNPKSSVRTQTNRTLHRRFVNAPPKRRCAIASKSVARLNAPSLKRSKSASARINETEPTT